MGIKELKEAMVFLKGALADAVAAKADGKISAFEMLQIALANAPAAVQAVMGLDQAWLEAQDLDKAEAQELAGLSIEIAKLSMQLFAKAA